MFSRANRKQRQPVGRGECRFECGQRDAGKSVQAEFPSLETIHAQQFGKVASKTFRGHKAEASKAETNCWAAAAPTPSLISGVGSPRPNAQLTSADANATA